MSAQAKILVICQSSTRFSRIRRACAALGRGVLRGVTNMVNAQIILDDGDVSLIILDQSQAKDTMSLCRVLHLSSFFKSRCKVLVIAEKYSEVEATLYFQMGVSDYLGLDEHRERLAVIVAELAGMAIPSQMELELANLA